MENSWLGRYSFVDYLKIKSKKWLKFFKNLKKSQIDKTTIELSFEYCFSKTDMRWITVQTHQVNQQYDLGSYSILIG